MTQCLLQQQTAALLSAYCDRVEMVEEIATEECTNCSELAPVRIEHPSGTSDQCELCGTAFVAWFGHECISVEVRRVP